MSLLPMVVGSADFPSRKSSVVPIGKFNFESIDFAAESEENLPLVIVERLPVRFSARINRAPASASEIPNSLAMWA
ncbi:MAG: hypothetical protein Athens101428_806, partial [Candidatus Berkelbacteria bacterium Athens1014_28]